MEQKYFAGICNMNDKDLRANPFHHSSLVLFRVDTDISGHVVPPLRVIKAYGYYSHPIPEKKSLFEDPFTFFSQMQISVRLRGSYGEWKEESIHDLTYGRGLSGRLFEMEESQILRIQANVAASMKEQQHFFEGMTDIQTREDYYQSIINNEVSILMQEGMSYEAAHAQVKQDMPVRDFKFGFHGDDYNCKVAALNMIESCANTENHLIAEQLTRLRKFAAVPRLTKDLKKIVIHGVTDHWTVRGNGQKYPFCSWDELAQSNKDELIVVDFGGQYVGLDGHVKNVFGLSSASLDVVDDLKMICRVCEINIEKSDFREWHAMLTQYIRNIAASESVNQEVFRVQSAKHYLHRLINSEAFQSEVDEVPTNLKSIVDETMFIYGVDDSTERVLRVF